MLSSHRMKMQSTHTAIVCLCGIVVLSLWPSLGSSEPAALPILPQVYIDTTYAQPTGNTIIVNAGGNLQTAINNASLGDTIVLQAGATFTGNFTLPNKSTGSGWIYIVSSKYSSLPAPGNRVNPTDAASMPTIESPYGNGGIGIQTTSNAHHYRFIGIEIRPVKGVFLYGVVAIGNNETSLDALPHDIIFDRCYIHGDPNVGSRRGVSMNGKSVAVIDSYVSDIKQAGYDTQALWSYNSPGPLKIVNNYLEAAGENVMFGGATPAIANLVPSDIVINKNYFFKPLNWMGSVWGVKNLLEFKNAQRVLVEGNRFENVWPNAQIGFAIVITPRSEDGRAPWAVTQDITFQLNTVVNAAHGFNIMGRDTIQNNNTHRLLIRNNVIGITGLGGAPGRIFQVSTDITDLTIDHNTAFNTASGSSAITSISGTGKPNDKVVFSNNIFPRGAYGFFGSGVGEGNACLKAYFTNWTFTNNAIIGPDKSSIYPVNNLFPSTMTAVGFADYANGDYHLSASSPYSDAGTDQNDLGADIDATATTSTGVAGSGTLDQLKNMKVVQ